ncbi:MAG: T9SS type A sorting domain-containing protein [Bacteroidia bacterium]|jgi:hypothetical protein|nr:T9SS type A sorting domain-containing protein [Bacteroidia bacterium]
MIKNGITWGLLFFFQIGGIFAQSWKYSDEWATIGWKGIEFNNHYIISTSFNNISSNITEPGFIVLDKNGKHKQNIEIPLTGLGFERVIFSSLHKISEDSLFCLGIGYDVVDSQTVFISLILNDSFKVLNQNAVKIVSNYGIPSRSYSPSVNLHKEANLNNFYGSYSICSTKMGLDEKPNLSSYTMPCFNIFFRMSYTGEFLFLKKTEANFNNKVDFLINRSNVGMQKLDTGKYLIGSHAQGYALINDSFELTNQLPSYNPEYLSQLFSNPFYFWNGKVYSSEVVEFGETIGNSQDYTDIFHNRLLVKEFNLKGELIRNKLFKPMHHKDSASYWVYENKKLILSNSTFLGNLIVSGMQSFDNNHLFVSYSNNFGIEVICLDSMLNIHWKNEIPIISGMYNFYHLLSTEDGGCLILGYSGFKSISGVPLPLVAIKLDKNGILSGGQSQEQNISYKLKVYPNPMKNEIHFETELNGCYEITLFSILGDIYYQNNFCSKEAILNTSNLPTGIYFFVLKSDNQEIFKGKLVRTE